MDPNTITAATAPARRMGPLERLIVGRMTSHLSEYGYSDEQIARLWPSAIAAAPSGGLLQWFRDHAGQIFDLFLTVLGLFAKQEPPANAAGG